MLIGIKGFIGSGKSTASKILSEKYEFTEGSVAEPLKDFAISIGFEKHQVYGTQEQKLEINKKWGISGREFLQKFGFLVRENVSKYIPNMKLNGKTLWIRSFELNKLEKGKNIVISDLRFPDEANLIKENGGTIIEIQDKKERNSVENKDISETAMKDITADFIIENFGTLEEFEQKFILLIEKIIKN